MQVNHVDSTCGSGCCGLLLLCIQGDAKRFLLEEVTNGETDVKPNKQPEKSSSKGNPILGSMLTVYANNKNKESITSDEDNHNEDDKNESYKSNGNLQDQIVRRRSELICILVLNRDSVAKYVTIGLYHAHLQCFL